MKKIICCILSATVALSLLCGCNMSTVNELYCLPKRSDSYTNLQSIISKSMSGCEFSAPISGENRQTVQSVDLSGDGEPEYLVFARDSAAKSLRIFVFGGEDGVYTLLDSLEATGSAFDKVEFIDMDSVPGLEIVVGRQVSDQVTRSVSVYTLLNGRMQQILNTTYSQYATVDLDDNGQKEVFILRPGESGHGVAAVYSVKDRAVERSQEIDMSVPAENIKRIVSGRLQDGFPAVYVAGGVSGSDSMITDVYALDGGQLRNISFSSETGTSIQTLRNYYVYADDIDGDGVLELPNLMTLKLPDSSISTEEYLIRWFSLALDAAERNKCYTYHNFSGSWYLELDGDLAQRITVDQKGNSYEFSLWDQEYKNTEKLMTVYVLTGQKREEQAIANNRFVLLRTETVIYAASLEVASSACGMTKESLISDFHLIEQNWGSDETK